MSLSKRATAEFLGTFWLVLGGCGSAVLAAIFLSPAGTSVGIGHLGVAFAFGLTVLTMAYAIGHISGCHLNPAVSIGLCVGKRFPAKELLPYIIAQVLGAIGGAAVLYVIASGKAGFDASTGFASNGYGLRSPGGYTLVAALVTEARSCRSRSNCDRFGSDPDPPDQHSGHQYFGESSAQHRAGNFRRRPGAVTTLVILAGADYRSRSGRTGLLMVGSRTDI